mgnify:CR=1 FL=1|jgi:hypothetical protein
MNQIKLARAITSPGLQPTNALPIHSLDTWIGLMQLADDSRRG